MSFAQDQLNVKSRLTSVRSISLPRRQTYWPSPIDWGDDVIYFLLVDRFNDGKESRPMLNASSLATWRPAGFRFDHWAQSGGDRYQGGTIAGITAKLDYIKKLGATTIWVSPVFKQRLHWDSYHGYAIQDFLEVDPRLGTRQDLVHLVDVAHNKWNMRVLLDIVFNHTGDNWVYANGQDQPPYLPWPQFYSKGAWRDGKGGLISVTVPPKSFGADDGVWPEELQGDAYYTRAGEGDLGRGDLDDPHAEFRRTDFVGDRDVNYDGTSALDDVARCYKYWIALTDADGLRIDTLKHVDQETGRSFCGTIKEFAANLGKTNFFLVGEVAGSNNDANRYLTAMGSNLSAVLEIGEIRPTLVAVAKGLQPADNYFNMLAQWDDDLGSHRNTANQRVAILDDHDHVSGDKVRFSADAQPADHQVVAGVALQLFGLGIPCIYYGTEQAFAGPEKSVRDQYLPDWNCGNPPPDKYLREAMFGPEHPRKAGRPGIGAAASNFDQDLPGFGPFGTSGAHCFNDKSPAFVRIEALTKVRAAFPALRSGRQYQRPISNFGGPFALPAMGELIAWSRLLDDEEALCIVNGNGAATRGGDVLVDASLNSLATPGNPWVSAGGRPSFRVVANSAASAAAAAGQDYRGSHPIGSLLPVLVRNGVNFVQVRDVPPAEVLVLINR
jgi:glycosidase